MIVTLHNVPVLQLALKIAAYRLLFDHEPTIRVTGTFKVLDHNLIAMNMSIHEGVVNSDLLHGSNLTINYEDKTWITAEPIYSTIQMVTLS